MALLVFKTMVGLNKVPGGFDSHPSPPIGEPGRDAFRRVRDFAGKEWDAVERVPTGCSAASPIRVSGSSHLGLTMRRVPQPPLDPALRGLERHDFWPGFIAALIGIILTFCGVRHLTAVDTVDGGNAWETQLIKAFTFDGLQYASKVTSPPPPRGDDPEALERWARQNREAEAPTWKVRVDTAAKTPCPT